MSYHYLYTKKLSKKRMKYKNNKQIFSGFAPNMTGGDILDACSFLFLPWKWGRLRKGVYTGKVASWMSQYLDRQHVYALDSGRSALATALYTAKVGRGDEVLVQAYTCMVVINAIIQTEATPVYIDIDSDYNINPKDLENKITDKSKAIIIQHTFGEPARMEDILKIAKAKNITTIEDCAHSLGAKFRDKQTGTIGDMAIYSFGSEKVISCGRGGILLVNNENFKTNADTFYKKLNPLGAWRVIQHLFTYPIFFIGKPLYRFGIGKLLFLITKYLGITSKIIYPAEKKGLKSTWFPSKLPNSLAKIALNQLNNLSKSNAHRKKIASLYNENLDKRITRQKINKENKHVYLDYSINVKNPTKLQDFLEKQGVNLSLFWSGSVVIPKYTGRDLSMYSKGTCPNAEKIVTHAINLPTHQGIRVGDAKKISALINKYEFGN